MRNEKKTSYKIIKKAGKKPVVCKHSNELSYLPLGYINGRPINNEYAGVSNVEKTKE